MRFLLATCTFSLCLLTLNIKAQESQLVAFDGDFADLFGYAVAIDGDYAVVGAPLQGGFGSNNAGAAYVYQLISGTWTWVKKLTPPWGGMPGEQFGYAVAIDSNLIAIGAPGTNHYGVPDAGTVYVYSGSSTTWVLDGTLTAPDITNSTRFAQQVDISGARIVVGAPKDDEAGNDAGAAYVFGKHYHNWLLESKLKGHDTEAGDAFGTDVAIDGTYIVVGAPANIGVDHKHSGAVYVFHGNDYYWHEASRLTHTPANVFDHLGKSVDIDNHHIIAGAPFAQDKTGNAYIFTGSADAWTQEAILMADDGAAHDKFGLSVSIQGGVAAVGAPFDDDLGAESGSVYLFEPSGTSWLQVDKFNPSDGAAQDKYGHAIHLDGNRIIAGAQNQDVVTTDAGAAYIIDPVVAPDCLPELYLTGTIQPGVYMSSDHIRSDGTLILPGEVMLSSPRYIELMPDFAVPLGAVLQIQLEGCDP